MCLAARVAARIIFWKVMLMKCATVKEGIECAFMAKNGCNFNGGTCHTIIEQCRGCERAVEFPNGTYCISFPDPSVKWRRGVCNMATHMKAQTKSKEAKLNPLKASKRATR